MAATVPVWGERAILFADIRGSTRLFELHGDSKALELVHGTLAAFAERAREFEGEVVKTTGDGVMAVFGEADPALETARSLIDIGAERTVQVGAGLHFGPVIPRTGDYYGDAVNVAARLTELAKPGEVVLSEEALLRLRRQHEVAPRLIDRTVLKGRSTPTNIYSVLGLDGATTQAGGALVPGRIRSTLALGCGAEHYAIKAKELPFVIGRLPECNLVLNAPEVSRRHATIDFFNGTFWIKDHSTNGTIVEITGGGRFRVVRGTFQLLGKGRIACGGPLTDTDPTVVAYAITFDDPGQSAPR